MTKTIPDLKGFETYYGLKVSDIGEDGDVIVLGHHDKRRALAALNRHARTFWGLDDLYDGRLPMFPDFKAVDDISERWAVLIESCGVPADEHVSDCWRCKQLAEADWWIEYGATSSDENAFPVMVWSP
jgi:hypothetical protein